MTTWACRVVANHSALRASRTTLAITAAGIGGFLASVCCAVTRQPR